MKYFFKSRKILIPDVPPPTTPLIRPGIVIAGISVLCATVVMATAIFVFLGA
jgi:hypothetical protein